MQSLSRQRNHCLDHRLAAEELAGFLILHRHQVFADVLIAGIGEDTVRQYD